MILTPKGLVCLCIVETFFFFFFFQISMLKFAMTINTLYYFTVICVIKSILLTYVTFYGCLLPFNLVTLDSGGYLSLISWNESDCLRFSLFVQLGGGL